MEMRTQPKDMVALTTLGLLSEQPCHPYEIQRMLRRSATRPTRSARPAALYRAIEELEAAGYIEPLETSREGRRPERTVYRITPRGQRGAGELARRSPVDAGRRDARLPGRGRPPRLHHPGARASRRWRPRSSPSARSVVRARRHAQAWPRTTSGSRGWSCSSSSTRSRLASAEIDWIAWILARHAARRSGLERGVDPSAFRGDARRRRASVATATGRTTSRSCSHPATGRAPAARTREETP